MTKPSVWGYTQLLIHFPHLPSAPSGRQQGGEDGIEGAHPDAVHRVDGPFPGRARGLLARPERPWVTESHGPMAGESDLLASGKVRVYE